MGSPKIHRVLVYTDKKGIPGWWTSISVADAAIGLRRVCFTAVELEKNVTSCIRYFFKILVRTSPAHR